MQTPTRDGETIASGRYRLVRGLGRGTFGDVYLAEATDPRTPPVQQQVVVKILHAQWAQVPEVVERFRRESQVTQKIDHPNVARVFEHSQLEDGVPFIAMEYLPGRSLRDVLEAGGLPYSVGLKMLAAIYEALGAAHRAGVVHRDLKPENIQIIERDGDPNYPVVLDFGVAKLLDAAERLTMTGALLGTPAYMSPEQFRGEADLGPPSDIYAMGVLAHELLGGHLPFEGQSFAELAVAHTTKPPPRLTNVPPQVADLVFRCLDKEPAKRPRADSCAQVLRGIVAGVPASQFVETVRAGADEPIDPFATTGAVEKGVLATVRDNANAERQRQAALQKQQRLLMILLATALFVLTSAIGLIIYFLVF